MALSKELGNVSAESEEESTERELSRAEYFIQLGEVEDFLLSGIIKAQTRLSTIKATRYKIDRAEINGLIVKFFEDEGRVYFTIEEKKPFGFKHE